MTAGLPGLLRALCLLGALSLLPQRCSAEGPAPGAAEKGVTFSHVYKIDLPQRSDCQLSMESLPPPQDQASGLQEGSEGENEVVFRHNIRVQTPTCDCGESEDFKSLLYRVNGLEEEVSYLKTQCSQGCCGKGGAAGVDTSCGGHGTYLHDSCSCECDPGWEGPDCSQSTCPDDCNDNGRCVDGKCVCHEGYTGEDCSQLACPGDCNDKGHCVDGKCVCFSHFTGEDCSEQRCPNDCIGNGRCVDGRCICDEGFFGDDCSQVLSPDGLRLVRVTDVSLLVEWEKVRGAEHYVLTHHPEGDKASMETVNVPNTENSYLITGLSPGVTYIVDVYAVIKTTQSEASTIQATTDMSGVEGIRVLGQTEDSIQVEWENPAAQLDFFRLSHATLTGSSEEQNVLRSQEARTKHTIIGLQPGTEYLISVQAVKGSSEGKASSVTGVTEIDAPKNLKAEGVTMEAATLTWLAPLADIKGYILTYRAEDGSMETVEKRFGARQTKFAVSGLTSGKSYIVTLIAYRGAKRSRMVETVFKTVGLMYPFPMDCLQIKKNGNAGSGIYTIFLNNDRAKPMEVYCDMETDGGGWLVIQRRDTGKLDFMKRWRVYIAGFGNMTEEFWLGLEKIFELTNTGTQYELRIDLGLGSEKVYAIYDNFKIAPVKQKFKLTIGKYRGTAGDAMTYHHGYPFSTVDSDNDIALGNCALTHRGAWWYKNCHLANLNGKFGDNRHSMGVNWEPWKGHLMSLDRTNMMIRPVGAGASRKRRSLPPRDQSRATPK